MCHLITKVSGLTLVNLTHFIKLLHDMLYVTVYKQIDNS
jgi:hypothetical protein